MSNETPKYPPLSVTPSIVQQADKQRTGRQIRFISTDYSIYIWLNAVVTSDYVTILGMRPDVIFFQTGRGEDRNCRVVKRFPIFSLTII